MISCLFVLILAIHMMPVINIVEDFDGVLNEFDKIIGMNRLKVLHINDSKNAIGMRKDRHENIGFGHIGFKALNYIVHHPQLDRYSENFRNTICR